MVRLVRSLICWIVVGFGLPHWAGSGPDYLNDAFKLPEGFHIYRAAGPELSGGSYEIAFDGQGRLLVGDGEAIRRLKDDDGNGVFDSHEVIATGLGWRGPQGLLPYGDLLYAVGGDGIQVFEGYNSSKLVHRGRIGNPLKTGGDHEAHTILRGHDGYLYLMVGDGAGAGERTHITEESSPVRFARDASVFRIDPSGTQWECISTGGRNPPNLGINYLGEFFSLDSDMEWHVDLPWYRPVRLNHWAIGGDQGWKNVGANPPYFIDSLPGILDVGRGSPNWGAFYEHTQFPDRYKNAFFVCDYRWKSASAGNYATTGRLLVFFLTRDEAGWKAEMEVFAIPNGEHVEGRAGIPFALVDVEVAPDGSLFLSDHNQGIWRIFYDGGSEPPGEAPAIVPAPAAVPESVEGLMMALLDGPQPGAEWARQREEWLKKKVGPSAERLLAEVSLDPRKDIERRLRAIRLIAPGFARLDLSYLKRLAQDPIPEIRGQSAWLLGLQERDENIDLLLRLFSDRDAFVRRRAAEALTRYRSVSLIADLLIHLGDPDRLTRFITMVALAHQVPSRWLERGLWETDPQVRMRTLVASLVRREPPPRDLLMPVVRSLLVQVSPYDAKEERLDLLRVLMLFRGELESDEEFKEQLRDHLFSTFPDPDSELRWEQVRVLGAFGMGEGISKLVALVRESADPVLQFHIAQALSEISEGWSEEDAEDFFGWILSTQKGWFAEFESKGLEFPHFWSTVLARYAKQHGELLLQNADRIDLSSLLGTALVEVMSGLRDGGGRLMQEYGKADDEVGKLKLIRAMGAVRSVGISEFLRAQLRGPISGEIRESALESLARQGADPANLSFIRAGLQSGEDRVVRACARAFGDMKPELDAHLARVLLTRMATRPGVTYAMDYLLGRLSGSARPGAEAEEHWDERASEQAVREAVEYWRDWYAARFGEAFQMALQDLVQEKADETVRDFLVSDGVEGGNPAGGQAVYERLQCASCHGNAAGSSGAHGLFGPDLAGITKRLSTEELADALVYPSRQVPERYKAISLELKNGELLTGFLTETNEEGVVLAIRDRVQHFARKEIRKISPEARSLMPAGLLNGLSWEEIRNLYAYLGQLGSGTH